MLVPKDVNAAVTTIRLQHTIQIVDLSPTGFNMSDHRMPCDTTIGGGDDAFNTHVLRAVFVVLEQR